LSYTKGYSSARTVDIVVDLDELLQTNISLILLLAFQKLANGCHPRELTFLDLEDTLTLWSAFVELESVSLCVFFYLCVVCNFTTVIVLIHYFGPSGIVIYLHQFHAPWQDHSLYCNCSGGCV
jgi:hypothetical protein